MSEITNPPMDDEPSVASPTATLDGENITNPSTDDETVGGVEPGFSIENPPA